MNYLQTDEDSAVEATELTTDATSPDDNWVIKVYKPAAEGNKPVVEGKPAEFVAKDLSREEDVREVLGWLNTKGWILLKEIGGGEHEWDVSRDKYVHRIITTASLLEHEKPTSDNPFVAEGILDLRCTFFAGDDSNHWHIRIAPDAEEQENTWETVVLSAGDVFICHFLLQILAPEPLIDVPEPLLPGSLRSWNWFQKAYVWGASERK